MTKFVVHSEKELHSRGGRRIGSRSVCTLLIWGESMGCGMCGMVVLRGVWPRCSGRFSLENKVTQDK